MHRRYLNGLATKKCAIVSSQLYFVATLHLLLSKRSRIYDQLFYESKMYILSSNSTQNTRGLEPTCYLPVQPHAFDVQHNLGATSIARNLTFGIYQPDVHTLTFDWQQQLLTEKLNSFQPSELLDPMGMNATDAVAAESTIKYHLVEAEEVGHKSQPSATRNPKPKRKSKFNWSQVPVEGDEMVTPESEESVGSGTNKEDVRADVRMRVGQYDQQHSRGGWYPRNGGRSGGRRQYRDSHGSFYNGVYVPTPDVTVTAQWAKNQMYVIVCSYSRFDLAS